MIGSVPFLGRSFLVYYGTDYTIATNAVSSPSRGCYVSLFVRSFQQQRVTRFRPLLGVPIAQSDQRIFHELSCGTVSVPSSGFLYLNDGLYINTKGLFGFRPLLGVPISQLLH